MRFTATVQVPAEAIMNLIISAAEGGSNYWIKRVRLASKHGGLDTPWYATKHLYEEDFEIHIWPEDEKEPRILTPIEVQQGLNLMAERYPHQMALIHTENDDAETADIFLQLCLFGEVIYG